MRFWVGWALWQKLSVVLAILLALVLIYSFCVLAHNRRVIKKHAAEEADMRAEQEAEKHPILTDSSDIPFGSRALQKGMEVEGIWTVKRNSLSKQPTVETTRSLGSTLVQKSTTNSVLVPSVSQVLESESQHTLTNADTNQTDAAELESIHIDTFRASRPPKLDIYKSEERKLPSEQGRERPRSRAWLSRSSWITKPFEVRKRVSVFEGHRRTSSEDFRRRFSKLFDENVPSRPAEMFQLTPIYQDSMESCAANEAALSK